MLLYYLRTYYSFGFLVFFSFFLLINFVVWFPVVNSYNVFLGGGSSSSVDKAIFDRQDGKESLLKNVMSGVVVPEFMANDVVSYADDILKGYIHVDGVGLIDLTVGYGLAFKYKSNWQLMFCGFFIPAVLVRAYRLTGNVNYLEKAEDFIVGWNRFEAAMWLPQGFVWNDHAVASRAMVLSEFWVEYRDSELYTDKNSKEVFESIERAGRLLSNDSLYTFNTNHGAMQNLAFLKLAAYFPSVDVFNVNRMKVLERALEQYQYLIDSSGVVMEHSAGYQKFVVDILDDLLQVLIADDYSIPNSLKSKFLSAKDFLAFIDRGVGYPPVGDTDVVDAVDIKGECFSQDTLGSESEEMVFPDSGYGVFRVLDKYSEVFSQVVMTWSYNVGMGHKHADELSLNIWSCGINLISNVGYWPYTDSRRSQAEGWSGSNAPHLINEKYNSIRGSKARYKGESEGVHFIDVTRSEASGFSVGRQVIMISPYRWLVVDNFSDSKHRSVRTLWNFGAWWKKCKISDWYYECGGRSDRLGLRFLSSDITRVESLSGAEDPLSGWIAKGQSVKPVNSLLLENDSKSSWNVFLFEFDGGGSEVVTGFDMDFTSEERWDLRFYDGSYISRGEGVLSVMVDGDVNNVNLYEVVNFDSGVGNLLSKAEARYLPKFRPLIPYRIKVSFASLCLFFVMSFVLFCVFAFLSRVYGVVLFCGCLFLSLVCVYLSEIYFL